MGLMDKFKNLFTDEEIIEEEDVEPVEIKEIKKEEVQQLPTFMREKIEKEKQEEQEKIRKEEQFNSSFDIKKELNLEMNLDKKEELPNLEEKNSFKFPIDISDNDFIETRSRQSIHHQQPTESKREISREPIREEKKITSEVKVADLYKDKKEEKKKPQEKKFKATPIISPIYGVLDKNYTPNDIEHTSGENFENQRHSKNVDFDSVRKKAYGSLSEEIKENLMCENCEYLKEAKQCKKEKVKLERQEAPKDELLYEILEDDSDDICDNNISKRDITFEEATENYYDYGVEYEKENHYSSIKQEEEEPIQIMDHNEEKRPKKEIPPVKSSINLLSTLKKSMGDESEKKEEKNLELTDDLFNLIDSMYDERNETK